MEEAAAIEALQIEVEELLASRARVVAAADAERRRIEHDLHDGAQQHLVALAVNVQLVRQLAGTDADAAAKLLDQIGENVREALESVRSLAHRIYPPLLLDRGLIEALRAAAGSFDLPPHVEAGPLDRFPADLESSAYFCCVDTLEALGVRRGEGGRATLRVWTDANALQFEVSTEGASPDEADPDGAALTHVADRIGALGGQLVVVSEPVRGTRVTGSIPLAR